jgi:SAM-dependent methyltransferase/GNAT superfamily N-acetyltransferase
MNYFAHQTAAERYAKSRPYFHPLVIDRIRAFLHIQSPVPVAVDVACGTGQSALALTEIASSVIAADIAPAMLAQALAHPRIRYVAAPAEQLPVETHGADLMTVSLAFHWLDRSRFLAEAHRILRESGALVIYSNGFFGQMKENPDFARWNRETYLTRYRTPPRNNRPLTEQDARNSSFVLLGREHYTNEISFSPEHLARYLMTQSNVIAAVEQGAESLPAVYSWLLESVGPLFPAPAATFLFGGEILFLQRSISKPPDQVPKHTAAEAIATPRRATLDDMAAIARIHRLAFFDAMPHMPLLHTPEEDLAFYSTVAFHKAEIWLTAHSGVITGFIAFRSDWVDHLYIRPEHQGRGFGSALLALAQASADSLRLWTFQCNLGARRFYEKHGFQIAQETDGAKNEEQQPDMLYLWTRSSRTNDGAAVA